MLLQYAHELRKKILKKVISFKNTFHFISFEFTGSVKCIEAVYKIYRYYAYKQIETTQYCDITICHNVSVVKRVHGIIGIF